MHWDDSWFAKITAKHKAVFDSPDIEDGIAIAHATGYIRGMRDALAAGVDDVQIVLVMRHAGVPMVLNDAMWTKYQIGKERKVKDYSNDKWATRNPFIGAPPSATGAARPASSSDRPQSTLTWLASHGHILLGCDLATRNYANVIARNFARDPSAVDLARAFGTIYGGLAAQIAETTKADSRAVYEELKANLVPGVILQPTGVYAVHRAQEAGCTFIRST